MYHRAASMLPADDISRDKGEQELCIQLSGKGSKTKLQEAMRLPLPPQLADRLASSLGQNASGMSMRSSFVFSEPRTYLGFCVC